ncbi:MAG: hypothetical protein PHF84_00325 [bacterium]|nr:hypothetical protein [bacterium]
MSKKILFFLFAGALLSFMVGCGSEPGTESYIKGDDYQTEGFLDDDTFQVIAEGTYPEELENAKKVIKRNRAKEGALLKAQTRAMELFKGYALKAKGGAESGVGLGEVALKTIDGYGKGGNIVKTTYDEEDNCSVVYRIEKKGLKKMAEAGFE